MVKFLCIAKVVVIKLAPAWKEKGVSVKEIWFMKDFILK